MARKISSEHEMQEVFQQAAGTKVVVVYFFDNHRDDGVRKELNTIAKDHAGEFYLAEICKYPDTNNTELFNNTQVLKNKYMPGGIETTKLVFFVGKLGEEEQVNFQRI